jgi:hypothetical protein
MFTERENDEYDGWLEGDGQVDYDFFWLIFLAGMLYFQYRNDQIITCMIGGINLVKEKSENKRDISERLSKHGNKNG